MEKKKPLVLISRCIEHEHCRYDGSMVKDKFIEKLKEHVDFIDICPEMEIGLKCPREALRLVEKEENILLLNSKTGEDFTLNMNDFSNSFLNYIEDKKINGVILKSKSPSCAIKDCKIYNDFGKVAPLPKKVSGLFAGDLIERFKDIAIEDEGRLSNFNIREHFLTRIFVDLDFESVIEAKSVKSLIDFQSDYKYLLMAYSPSKQKELGRIVAKANKKNIEDSLLEYKIILRSALSNRTNKGRNVNMLLHLLGYFSDSLSKEEKSFFLDSLQMYQEKKVPFLVPLSIIKSWSLRFNNEYLLRQKIFEAFPTDLLELKDSGK